MLINRKDQNHYSLINISISIENIAISEHIQLDLETIISIHIAYQSR